MKILFSKKLKSKKWTLFETAIGIIGIVKILQFWISFIRSYIAQNVVIAAYVCKEKF